MALNGSKRVKMFSIKQSENVILLVILSILAQNGHCYMVGNNPYHRRESLDSKRYQLEWLVDWRSKLITFNVTVQTTGYIGFGLTENGKMTGADIIIGGVNKGRSYFGDFHAIGQETPVRDDSQDWDLLSASENQTHTTLCFSRSFDTCDPHDYRITTDQIAIIWAFGSSDEIKYHSENRGIYHLYLLHPDYSPLIISDPATGVQRALDSNGNIDTSVEVWTINREMGLLPQETLYYCTMHKTPRFSGRNQLIGFNVRLHDNSTMQHVHHFGVTRCHPPRGGSQSAFEMFDRFVNTPGGNCLGLTVGVAGAVGALPIQYCTELNHAWGIGGLAHFHPPHVGFPFESEEYYMLQVHLDNPSLLSNARVNFSVDFFYREDVRQNQGGLLSIRHEIPGLSPSFLIPPYSIDHQIHGICGSDCTRDMIPPKGIYIYGVFLHTHDTGRRIRVRHFRGYQELPFIAADGNFFPTYQPVLNLPQERKILPGDQVIVECVFDSTLANGTVVGGFATSQEMCVAGLLHYERISEFSTCGSEIVSLEDRRYFLTGVENITWSVDRLEFTVNPPHPLAGLSITEVSNNHVNWTIARREELQRYHNYRPHRNRCTREFWARDAIVPPTVNAGVTVNFPYRAKPFVQDRKCGDHVANY